MEHRTVEEIEVEGVGAVRVPNSHQQAKAFKRRKDGHRRILAYSCGRTLAEFNRLPAALQDAVHRAYRQLIDAQDPAYAARPKSAPGTPVFDKGRHRTDEEKIAIGRGLIRVKENLPAGYFGPWLDEAGIPRATAQVCMRMAREEA